MRMTKTFMFFLFFLALLSLSPQVSQAQTPQETLTQYISDLQKNPNDNALREKIIKHVQWMKPAPAVPEEARRYFIEGNALLKAAKDQNGYGLAIDAYRQCLLIAPWWAEAYYNYGVALELANQFDEAVNILKLYIYTTQGETESRKAQDKIYEIGAKKKLAAQQAKEQKEAEKKVAEEKAKASLDSLSGAWKGAYLNTGLYNRPDISSDWAKSSSVFEVSVTGNNFEAILISGGKPFHRFKGIIYGNKISGTFYDVSGTPEWSCGVNPSSPLEGEISQDRNTILLIVRGTQLLGGGNCKYDPERFSKSYKLER